MRNKKATKTDMSKIEKMRGTAIFEPIEDINLEERLKASDARIKRTRERMRGVKQYNEN